MQLIEWLGAGGMIATLSVFLRGDFSEGDDIDVVLASERAADRWAEGERLSLEWSPVDPPGPALRI